VQRQLWCLLPRQLRAPRTRPRIARGRRGISRHHLRSQEFREVQPADRRLQLRFVSIDLLTAQHPQTLLAIHLNGKPLTVEHGGSAPTACTCEIRPEEHQGDYADYLYEGRTAGLLGKARVFAL
jgi:hypothetical protein